MKINSFYNKNKSEAQWIDPRPQTLKHKNLQWNRVPETILASLLMMGVSTSTVAQSDHPKTQKKEQTRFNGWSEDKKIHLNGITITPGGYFAGEGVWRSRNLMTDMSTNFSVIPTLNLPQAYINELRLSARQSRMSALVEGNLNPDILISGYVETDFLGNGTGNSNQTNSYDLRIRNFYNTIDWNSTGWHLLAGQNWSLMTPNNKGITPRNELILNTIENATAIGFLFKREAQLRLTKNWGKEFWAALSIENPQTTFGGTPTCLPTPGGTGAFDGVANVFCNAPGTGSLPAQNNYSFNRLPDLIGKLAYEPVINGHEIHIEGFGYYRDFYDRVYYSNAINGVKTNIDTSGYGGGVAAFAQVVPDLLDVQANLLAGTGFGSYTTGTLPDTTFGINGRLQPIREIAFLAGGTVHATPALDIYVYGGKEKQNATYFYSPQTNQFYGVGTPNANNSGCNIEGSNPNLCQGSTKELWQVTVGLWDKVYSGAYGNFKAGLQYSYTKKILFPGTGAQIRGVPTGVPVGADTNDQVVYASLRYYPFAVNDVSPTAFVK
jgi:hypothetical protein